MAINFEALDEQINTAVQPVADFVSSVVFYAIPVTPDFEVKIILIWLALAALFFTLYLGFVQFRLFGHAVRLLFQKETGLMKPDGQITRFQALASSLSGTVGLGNIAGVAVAISVGGPGAMVWMILMGFLAMASKFAEVTASVHFREHPDPERPEIISGGPMYYLQKAFDRYNLSHLGGFIAAVFAFFCICGAVGGGNMFQSNQAYQQLVNVSGGEASFFADKGWLFGLILAGLVGVVIVGGIKSIANVASRLVPAMGALYIVAGLVVVGMHYANIPAAMGAVFQDAFSMEAGLGGLLGGLLVGVQRAAFSNEAGLGSAAIVHATARTENAVSQGLVAMLGPFIDTIVICSVTALVIVITGVYETTEGVSGIALTSEAFASGLPWFPYVLALTAFLFAYSTILTWYYYGQKGSAFLFGENRYVEIGFQVIFCLCIVIGSSMPLSQLIGFSDAMILAMGFPNILGLFLLAPLLRKELKKYEQDLERKQKGLLGLLGFR